MANPTATLQASLGDIELLADKMPMTAGNFIKLAAPASATGSTSTPQSGPPGSSHRHRPPVGPKSLEFCDDGSNSPHIVASPTEFVFRLLYSRRERSNVQRNTLVRTVVSRYASRIGENGRSVSEETGIRSSRHSGGWM